MTTTDPQDNTPGRIDSSRVVVMFIASDPKGGQGEIIDTWNGDEEDCDPPIPLKGDTVVLDDGEAYSVLSRCIQTRDITVDGAEYGTLNVRLYLYLLSVHPTLMYPDVAAVLQKMADDESLVPQDKSIQW